MGWLGHCRTARPDGRGGSAHSPFAFECVDDPSSWPKMVDFEFDKQLYHLISLERTRNKWAPYEDGVA